MCFWHQNDPKTVKISQNHVVNWTPAAGAPSTVVLEVVLGSAQVVERVRDLEVVWAELALRDAAGALLELLRVRSSRGRAR